MFNILMYSYTFKIKDKIGFVCLYNHNAKFIGDNNNVVDYDYDESTMLFYNRCYPNYIHIIYDGSVSVIYDIEKEIYRNDDSIIKIANDIHNRGDNSERIIYKEDVIKYQFNVDRFKSVEDFLKHQQFMNKKVEIFLILKNSGLLEFIYE